MFKYGLYLLDEGKLFNHAITPVEGILHPPGTKIIGVWTELKYEGETLVETLPYKKIELDEEYVDELVNRMIKRLNERVKYINTFKKE